MAGFVDIVIILFGGVIITADDSDAETVGDPVGCFVGR